MTTQQTDAGMAALADRFRAEAYGAAAAGGSIGGDDADPGAAAVADLALAGRLEAHLGTIGRELTAERQRKAIELARRLRGVAPVWLPPVSFAVTGGALAIGAGRASSADFGPQDGYVWFLTHLVAAGLTAPAGGGASAMGTVTNPGAAATITSINGATLAALSPAGGLYDVSWTASLQGTVAAGDGNNMRLTSPLGTTQELGLFPGVAGNYPQDTVRLFIPGGTGVNVQAIGAASGASAIYGAQIAATLVSGQGDTVNVFKASATGLNNFLHSLTAAQPDWSLSSSSVFLLPDDYLVLAGTGLAASQVVLTGQAIQVELALLADYLI